MIIDKELMFDSAEAVTTDAYSKNVLDLGVAADQGTGEDMTLVIMVDDAVTAAGAATVTFTLESDSVAAMNVAPKVHFSSGAIGKAALTAGKVPVTAKLPAGDYGRYLAVKYTIGTGPLLTGKFTAMLVKDADAYKVYADKITIS